MKELHVLGICGSQRKGGNTEKALDMVLSTLADHGIKTELVQLYNRDIRGCTSCRYCRAMPVVECSIRDDFYPEIFEKMVRADGIILGAPVYFGSIPAKMKGLLERAGMLSEGRISIETPVDDKKWPGAHSGIKPDKKTKGGGLYRGKVGGAIVTTRRTGANAALAELLMWFMICNFTVVSSSYWTVLIGGTRIPDAVKFKKEGKEYLTSDLSKDTLEQDEEGREDLVDFAENFIDVLFKLRG
ncbi:MAG: flavodoxin family protein [Theionarchaea archaeon]|nr:flavodoxin family protein [Theionarchaea archaeon]